MTIEIDEDRKYRALHPPAAEAEPSGGSGRLIVGIRIAMIAAATTGLVLAGIDIDIPRGMRLSIYAAACFTAAGLCGALLCLHAMLADRQEFFRRGQLDGWMKGWRGQAPEVDDPLLR